MAPASGSGGSLRPTNTWATPSPEYGQALATGSSQRPFSREPEDGPRTWEPAKDTVPGAEHDGDGPRVSTYELFCNYAIGKAKPLVFGQLLAFWLVRMGFLWNIVLNKNNRMLKQPCSVRCISFFIFVAVIP